MIRYIEDGKFKKLLVFIVLSTMIVSFGICGALFVAWNYFRPSVTFDGSRVSAANVRKLDEVKRIIEKDYYKEIDENILIEGAIKGMADSLGDPYTMYLDKDQNKTSNDRIEGTYVGIGALVSPDENGLETIEEFFEGSPAEKAGIKVGDKILEVDGRDVTKVKNVTVLLKGKEGSTVKLLVYRPAVNKKLVFEVLRKRIDVPSVTSKLTSDGIGYIRIILFDAKSGDEFETSLNSLLKQNIKGLVIDLRGNPGGFLSQVVKIADRLLPEGTIVYTVDRYDRKLVKESGPKELGLPLALLINGDSASASEILAGSVKDFKKGILVGTKTFGKGVVQTPYDFKDGSGFNVTTSRYFTPSGVCIHGIGIQPDVEVRLAEKYNDMPVSQIPLEDDLQLEKAFEILRNQIR